MIISKSNNIIVTGITGQDGIFLTKLLLEKTNAKIFGISREKNNHIFFENLNKISSIDTTRLNILDLNLLNKHSVKEFLRDVNPSALFNLSGPSSVYDSIKYPELGKEIEAIFNNLTSSMIELENYSFFYQASSSEMYGSNDDSVLNEESIMLPQSPYAESKYKNHLKTQDLYRTYNWNIVSGIMFNHESEFRKKDFLLPKIINTAFNYRNLGRNELLVGSLNLIRDWTHAYDISKAIFSLYTSSEDIDSVYVIGRGSGNSVKDMIEEVSKVTGVNLLDITKINGELLRKGDPLTRISDPTKIREATGWSAETEFSDMISKIISNL